MKLRIMGSADQIERVQQVLAAAGLGPQGPYPNRRGTGARVYCDLDDRDAERILDQIEQRGDRIERHP